MNIPYSAMVTYDGTINFTHIDGRLYNIMKSHPMYERAIELVKVIPSAENSDELRMELYEISQPRKLIARSSNGRILVDGDVVTFDEKPVEGVIAKRLLWMIEQGFDAEPLFNFLTLLAENPSYRAVKCLYGFMEANKMAITPEGKILAYKRVKGDYTDVRTGKMDNSVGKVVSMPRNEVNEDPNQTCSAGLHVCSMTYLPHYGAGEGNRVVVCEIHPKDVVAVPIDYNNAKMRVCEYLVVGEVDDTTDILGTKAVMSFSLDEELDEDEDIEEEDDIDDKFVLETAFDDVLSDYFGNNPSLDEPVSDHLGMLKIDEFLDQLYDAAEDEGYSTTAAFDKLNERERWDSLTFLDIKNEFLKSRRK